MFCVVCHGRGPGGVLEYRREARKCALLRVRRVAAHALLVGAVPEVRASGARPGGASFGCAFCSSSYVLSCQLLLFLFSLARVDTSAESLVGTSVAPASVEAVAAAGAALLASAPPPGRVVLNKCAWPDCPAARSAAPTCTRVPTACASATRGALPSLESTVGTASRASRRASRARPTRSDLPVLGSPDCLLR